MRQKLAESVGSCSPDELYEEAAASYGAPLERLVRAYEADPEERRDLLQEVHLAIWRSLRSFDQRCSLRTWVYRVAHNTAASHIIRQRRSRVPLVSLEEIEAIVIREEDRPAMDRHAALEHLLRLIQRLKPIDRQIILCYLEGMDAASIGEITGLTPSNVATKIHRVKQVLARRSRRGGSRGE